MYTFAGIRFLHSDISVKKLMKLISMKSVIVPVIAFALLAMAACNPIKKAAKKFEKEGEIKGEPSVLEVHGDSVAYQIKVTPPKKFNKKAAVKIEPVLQYEGDTISLPPKTVKAAKVDSETGTVTLPGSFAYDPKMKKSKLVADATVMIEGDERELNTCITVDKEYLVADGIITTSRMLKADDDVAISVDEYVPVNKTQTVEVHYLVNSANFNPNFRDRNAEINNKASIDSLSGLLKNPEFEIIGLNFNSYASPDGEMAFNEELSKDRSDATVKWFQQHLKKVGRYEMYDSNFKAANHFTEDWNGWKALVQASDLEDKDAILNIMNSNISDDEKEARIKANHAKSYEKMKTYMLPKLRRTQIVFTAKGGLRTDEELKAMANSLDDLSQAEVLQLAKITTDNKEKKRIYSYYVGKYSDDWRGYNNLAAVNLMSGEVDEATKNLEKADQLSPDNAAVLNNMGVAYKMKNQYAEAEAKYTAAKSRNDVNVKPDYNLGTLYTRMGKYDKAIDSYSGTTCRYNVGLAYLLKGEYDNAERTFNCIPADKKDGATYYLMAVTAARKNNAEGVTTNLAQAFKMDPTLKDQAKDDLEFRNYKDKAEYQNLFR